MEILLNGGFAALIRHWMSHIDLAGEEFLRERGERIRAVAASFDAQIRPDQGPLDFAACMETFRAQESESPGAIRLMTVHQAKGLTFDLCMISGLDEMVRDRFTGALHLGGENATRWGMLWPGREWTDADDTLRAEREKMLADAAYESLCTTYVAFTRARLGLFVFTNALKPTSKARTLDRFLSETLGSLAGEEGCILGDCDDWI
jgi:ATP-dependent exoDNAse (exonuclease V) beta subunit